MAKTAQKSNRYPDMVDKFKAMELRAEHQRLQSAVVEAVKVRHDAQSDFWDEAHRGSRCVEEEAALQQADCDLRVAVDALIAFEVEHGIGEQG